MKSLNKMLCLVDGEHYLPVTQEAIDTLNNLEHIDIAGAVFIGGTEKLSSKSERICSAKGYMEISTSPSLPGFSFFSLSGYHSDGFSTVATK